MWHEQPAELVVERGNFRVKPIHVGTSQLDQLRIRVASQFARLFQFVLELGEAGGDLADRIEPGVLPPKLPELRRIARDLRCRKFVSDFSRAGERGLEPRLQRYTPFGPDIVAYRRRNRSTRPAVLTRRCFPAKNGWQ